MKTFQQSIPLIKIIIYFYICYRLGMCLGTLISYFLHHLHMLLMDKIFQLEPLSPQDMNFIWSEENERYNLVTFLIFEQFDTQKIKNLILEKGIKNFRKLRSKVVYKFFEWYWEERKIDEALERIEIIENNDKYCFISHEDLIKFTQKEIENRFDLLNELPYKFVIINNEKAKLKNLLMIKFDHSLTDGLGYIGLICALADNYSLDLFPKTHTKNKAFIDYFILFIMIPYYVFYSFYRNLVILSTGKSPFKLNKNMQNSGRSNIEISKNFNFNTVSKICKSLNVTFNDLMMSIISSSCRKFCIEFKLEIPKEISAAIPIGHRRLPKNFKDIRIVNDSSAVGCKIDIIDDPIKDCLKIHKEFKEHVRNIPFITLTKFLTDIVFKFFPDYLTKLIIRNASRNFDFTISNVPGPKNALFYGEGKILELMAFTSPGYFSSFIGIFSYNGEFRYLFCFDEVLGINVKEFKKFIEKEIEYVFANVKVKDD